MTLSEGFHQVPPGHLATVVTHLEMRRKPADRAAQPHADLTLVPCHAITTERYRALFQQIGQDYLWFSRLTMPETELRQILDDAGTEIYTLQKNGQDLALLELDFRTPEACELAFFGLDQSLIGSGAGRLLMNHAIRLAFAKPIARFHVHTCTLDSPQALQFYIRSGFTPYRQEVEIAPDPRLLGKLPKTAAPQIPIYED